jgi:hypothetical protein
MSGYTLPCPKCDALLNVDGVSRYLACAQCESTVEVKRHGGTIALAIPIQASSLGIEKEYFFNSGGVRCNASEAGVGGLRRTY